MHHRTVWRCGCSSSWLISLAAEEQAETVLHQRSIIREQWWDCWTPHFREMFFCYYSWSSSGASFQSGRAFAGAAGEGSTRWLIVRFPNWCCRQVVAMGSAPEIGSVIWREASPCCYVPALSLPLSVFLGFLLSSLPLLEHNCHSRFKQQDVAILLSSFLYWAPVVAIDCALVPILLITESLGVLWYICNVMIIGHVRSNCMLGYCILCVDVWEDSYVPLLSFNLQCCLSQTFTGRRFQQQYLSHGICFCFEKQSRGELNSFCGGWWGSCDFCRRATGLQCVRDQWFRQGQSSIFAFQCVERQQQTE